MTAPSFPLWGSALPAPARGVVDIAVGIQWGDEGKGRVVDRAAADYDIVARFGGGNNAGHTIVVGDRTVALHVVPSGALVASTKLFIGGGTVVSLGALIEELDALSAIGVDVTRIAISDRAHVVFPYHAALDRLSEAARGAAAIGTTGRGIGPAYIDKAARLGITFGDLRTPAVLAQKVRTALLTRNAQFSGADQIPREEDVIAETLGFAERLVPHIVDGVAYIQSALARGERILAEGAQGTLLDVGYGSYPYVTSSHTIAGGACTGLGIGPRTIGRVTGIVKAYCTRVGAGPFPSELSDAVGERLRARGREFGVVTGRPRRCGWFDAVAAKYAAQVNGLSDCVLTKLDVLTGFDRVGIVTGYRVRGAAVGIEAMGDPDLETEVTWYEGWSEDISQMRTRDELPDACVRYVAALEAALQVPFAFVSVGPERSALIP